MKLHSGQKGPDVVTIEKYKKKPTVQEQSQETEVGNLLNQVRVDFSMAERLFSLVCNDKQH